MPWKSPTAEQTVNETPVISYPKSQELSLDLARVGHKRTIAPSSDDFSELDMLMRKFPDKRSKDLETALKQSGSYEKAVLKLREEDDVVSAAGEHIPVYEIMSSPVLSSPVVRKPPAKQKEQKKKQRIYISDDDEYDMLFDDLTRSHDKPSPKKKPKQESQDKVKPVSKHEIIEISSDTDNVLTEPESDTEMDYGQVVKFFNEASDEDLASSASCNTTQLAIVKKHRPYATYDQLYSIFDSTKGVKVKLIESYIETLEAYKVMDGIVKKCQVISDSLSEGLDQLSKDDHTELDGQAFITSQPALLSHELQLKDYQLVGVNWLYMLYQRELSGILADTMGLGKTCQVIALISYLVETGVEGKFLIIVPSSTIENWAREIQRWCPTLVVHTYHGSQSDRASMRYEIHEGAYNILLTTYTMLQSKEDRTFLKRSEFLYMIVDEAHMLKNFTSQRYITLNNIKTKYRLLLTGTPLQNNLQELLSLLIYIMPDLFAAHEQQLRKVFAHSSDSTLSRGMISSARSILAPFCLRRQKQNVLKDLPKKTEVIVRCETTVKHRELYDRVRREFKSNVNERSATQNILMELRKLSIHPLLANGINSIYYPPTKRKDIADLLFRKTEYYTWMNSNKSREKMFDDVRQDVDSMMDYQLSAICEDYSCLKRFVLDQESWVESGKIRCLLTILRHHMGLQPPAFDDLKTQIDLAESQAHDKVLIFSQFSIVLDILSHILTVLNVPHARLDGSLKTMDRQPLIDSFTESSTTNTFLLTTKAGCCGINLTAANVVILFDLDFNPFNDSQAEDRAHRVGQERDVVVYKLVTRSTVEERILEVGKRKLSLDMSISNLEDEVSKDVLERELGD